MKILEGKHNHNLTTILKSCLFGLIMILPFLAILPSMLYFAFNHEAANYTHEEVIETYEYETNEVNSVDDLVVGNIYKVSISNEDFNNLVLNTRFIEFTALYKMNVKQTINNQSVNYDFDAYHGEQVLFGFYKASSNTIVNYLDYNNPALAIRDLVVMPNDLIQSMEFYIIFSALKYNNFLPYINASDYLGEKNVEVVSSEQSPLNAFNTASNNVWNSPIFNWVNSGLGSIAIANMLTVFGIARNTFISNILIYWLSITAIYIIIDIVITAFTILTHILMKKAE